MRTLYLSSGGGLGDTIYNFFMKEDWRSIKNIKENYPQIELITIFHSHCKEAAELVTFNPFIDGILSYKWYNKNNPNKFNWKNLINNNIKPVKEFIKKNKTKQENNSIFLNTHEQKIYEDLTKEPYVVVAPFAGSSERTILSKNNKKCHCLPQETLLSLLDKISIEHKVIIIGQSNTINEHHNNRTDQLPYINDKIIDLTNKTPLRVTIKLAQSATGFIGTHSSLLVAAWTKNIPSIYFYPTLKEKGLNNTILANGGEAGTFKYSLPIHFGYEKSAEEFKQLPVNKIYDKFKKVLDNRCKI